MKKKLIGQLVLVSSVLLVCSSKAQTGSAVQQSDRSQRFQEIQAPKLSLEEGESAPELYSGENQDVGPQRILRLKPRRSWWEAAVDSQVYWTDNANLAASAAEVDAFVFINTIQAALAPTGLTFNERPIFPRIGVRAQWYNYTDDTRIGNSLDFHNQVAFAEVRYNFAENWQIFLGVNAGRLTDQDGYDEFYREVAPNWGARYLWKISDNKVFSFNYHGFYHISTTEVPPVFITTITGTNITTTTVTTPESINNRTDHNFTISYNQEICPRLVLQPFYRFQFTHYTGASNGNDYLHDVGVNLSYYFNRWASARTFLIYETKDSGSIYPDYDKFDVGLGVTLDFQF